MDLWLKIQQDMEGEIEKRMKIDPPVPTVCKFCGGKMKVLYDCVDEVESECVDCGSIRFWEDSPVGFGDYWKDNRSEENRN